MSERRPVPKSYLIRLWPASQAGQVIWRISLEDPHTGERVGFAGLDQLIAFLEQQLGLAGQEPTGNGERDTPSGTHSGR